MATDTLTAMLSFFKNKYEPEFAKVFNEEAIGFQMSQRVKRDFRGGVEVLGVQTGRAGGVGARGETQSLPAPRGFTPKQMQVALSRVFKMFEVSHDAVERSIGDDAAFGELLGKEILTGYDRVKKLSNIYFWGDGSGVLATIATGGGGTLAALNASTLQVTVDTTRYLEEGDPVALWTTKTSNVVLSNGGQTDSLDSEKVVINSVDSEILVTLKRTAGATGAATVVANNVIRLYGDSTLDASSNLVNNAPTGLQAFADDGTNTSIIQTLDRTLAGNTRLKGQYIDLGSTPLKKSDLMRLNDKIHRKGNLLMDVIGWDLSLRREYLGLVQPDVRWADIKEFDAGYGPVRALTLGEKSIRLVEDVDVPYGMVFGWPMEALMWMSLTDLQIDDSTGSVLKQALPYGSAGVGDVFYGFMRLKGNWATHTPNAFGRIVNAAYVTE